MVAFPTEKEIIQYRTPTYYPKRNLTFFIGTFQKECLDYHYEPMNAAELQTLANDWSGKYHSCHPHEAPGGVTLAEFFATLNLPIPTRECPIGTENGQKA